MVGKRKRKSREKKKSNHKLTKQIYANLFKISMKIDNYIYNNEPIPISEAKQMKDELRTYKKITKNDVRCLQIINKQTRLLQGIVTEEENISKSIVYDANANILENIQHSGETEKVKDSSFGVLNTCDALSDGKLEPKLSIDIHSNTTVECSPDSLYPTDIGMIDKSATYKNHTSTKNNFGLTNLSPNSHSDTLVQTSSLTLHHTTPETSSSVFDQSAVQQNNKCEISHDKNMNLKTNSKRRKNANHFTWIQNMKYVRVVEADEFDTKLSNLGKLWDNFQLPDWDDSEFSLD